MCRIQRSRAQLAVLKPIHGSGRWQKMRMLGGLDAFGSGVEVV